MFTNQIVLVDSNDQVIGNEEILKVHQNPPQLHRAISVLIFNSKKQLLLQQRSKSKPLWPLFWANSCCGNKRPGYSMKQFARQRLKFEMGLNVPLKFLYKFTYQAKYNRRLSEHEIDYVYLGFSDKSPTLNHQEAVNYKYLSIKQVNQELKNNPEVFTPWFKLIMKKITSSDILTS